ncbi:AbrB family transcriptional regulator [Tropicimonas sp. IMCC6043]|nr:AbrB family transcriptional regulator [Tropicimonas sp. IMCC6043]
MFACLVFALAGAQMAGMGRLGVVFRTLLGVAAGASITPETLARAPEMALSLAFVPLFIAVIGLTSYPLLRRGFGFDQITSYYAAMPGGLQDMLVFGEQAGGNVRVLSLVHATRVLLIVIIAPVALHALWGTDLHARPGLPAAEIPPQEIALMLASALVGWQVAERLGLFGASILGPMILTAVLSLTGLIHNRPPAEIIWAAQFFIGLAVGAKYTGVTVSELRRIVSAATANALLLAAISLVFIEVIAQLQIAPGQDAFLAFLPGGQGEMVILAIIAGADLTYVALHHVFRLVLVVICAPLVMRLFNRRWRI